MSRPCEMDVLRWAETVPLPWKNGTGLTRELASLRASDALGTFDWRVSVADVAVSGDFSSFADVDRIIVFVEGPAMTLTLGATTRELSRFEPFGFSGDVSASCSVPSGPTRDLNIMTRRDRFRAAVEVIDIGASTTCHVPGGAGVHLFIPLPGRLDATVDGGDGITLRSYDVLRVRRAGTVQFSGSAHLACVEISPLTMPAPRK